MQSLLLSHFGFLFDPEIFNSVIVTMSLLAVVVFFCLHKIEAGYGMMYTKKWGPAVNNRLGWVLMEAPAFIAMAVIWFVSPRRAELAPAVMAGLFLFHYFQRSFVFPLMIKGKGRMPFSIILMGAVFNTVNAYMIGGWLFYVSPQDFYPISWLRSWQFLSGLALFAVGMAVNWHSDGIVRRLRKPGDNRHYIPRGGMYRYVTSANYFGEFVEWCGYALLTWSVAGAVFALWTFANLAPRAARIQKRYEKEFGDAYTSLHLKKILPFIY